MFGTVLIRLSSLLVVRLGPKQTDSLFLSPSLSGYDVLTRTPQYV